MYPSDASESPGTKGQHSLEGAESSGTKSHRQSSHTSRIIEPLPGPSSADWKKRQETDVGARKTLTKSQKTTSVPPIGGGSGGSNSAGKPFLISNNSSKANSQRSEFVKSSRQVQEQQTVLDRYGRSMPVKDETIRVLKQLPDISFLSARTLLYNPEQKQIVQDLGAMINRKMPG